MIWKGCGSNGTRRVCSAFRVALRVGLSSLPLSVIVAKEIDLRGTFRFHEEFAWAASLLASGKLDLPAKVGELRHPAHLRALALSGAKPVTIRLKEWAG